MPKISVIVPVYNVEKYLKRCVDSIINQTFTNIEIILVNDGSPDNCPALCDEYAKADKRILVIHKENGGLSSARNAGMEIATGDFFSFVDSDDEIDLTMLEKLYNRAIETSSDLAISKFLYFVDGIPQKPKNDFEETLTELDDFNYVKLISSEDRSYNNQPTLTVCNNLFNSSLIKQRGLKFTDTKLILAEDVLFLYSYLAIAKRLCRVNEELYFYYRRNDSIMANTTEKDYIQRLINFVFVLGEFLKKNNPTLYSKSQLDCILWFMWRGVCLRYHSDVNLILRDFNAITEHRDYFKSATRRLALGSSGTMYCKFYGITGKMMLHFRLMAFCIYRGNYEKPIVQYFAQ